MKIRNFEKHSLCQRVCSLMLVILMLVGNFSQSMAQNGSFEDDKNFGFYRYQGDNKVREANEDLERRTRNLVDYYIETMKSQETTVEVNLNENQKLLDGTSLKDYLAKSYPVAKNGTNKNDSGKMYFNTGMLGDPVTNGSLLSYRRIAAGLYNYKVTREKGDKSNFKQKVGDDFPKIVEEWTSGIFNFAHPGTSVDYDSDGKEIEVSNRIGDYDMHMKEMISLIYLFKDIKVKTSHNEEYVLSNDSIYNIIQRGLKPAIKPWKEYFHIALKLKIDNKFYSNIPNYSIISETENHLLMTLSSVYLTNQWIEKNFRGLSIKPVEGVSNTDELKDMLLKIMGRIVYSDFFETNSRNYEVFSLQSLLNLYAFSEDESIRKAARNALDYATAKFAFQSFEGKRYAPHRRNLGYIDRLDVYENDSTVFVMNTLSGAYTWNDEITGDWEIDKRNYFMGGFIQGMGHSLWAAMISSPTFTGDRYFYIQPQIHDFMLDKHNGYWARMQSRFTGKNYNMELVDDPDSSAADPVYFDENGGVSLKNAEFTNPSFYLKCKLLNWNVANLKLVREEGGGFQPAQELYFVTPDYINISGGKMSKYPSGNEQVEVEITDKGRTLDFFIDNIKGALIGFILGAASGANEAFIRAAIGIAIEGANDDESDRPPNVKMQLGEKGAYDFNALPSTVLTRDTTGNWFNRCKNNTDNSISRTELAKKVFMSENICMSSEWKPGTWRESNNLGTYKSVSYGINLNIPTSWIPYTENDTKYFYMESDTDKKVKISFYEISNNCQCFVIVAQINRTQKALWEIVPKNRFEGDLNALKNATLNSNKGFVCGTGLTNYKMTNGETLTLSPYAGAKNENPIMGIASPDGAKCDLKDYYVGENAKEMPLIDVREVDQNYNFTGVKYAYSSGDGKIYINNPFLSGKYPAKLCIDSSDYRNPRSNME